MLSRTSQLPHPQRLGSWYIKNIFGCQNKIWKHTHTHRIIVPHLKKRPSECEGFCTYVTMTTSPCQFPAPRPHRLSLPRMDSERQLSNLLLESCGWSMTVQSPCVFSGFIGFVSYSCYNKLSRRGLEQYKLTSLLFWRPVVWDGCHWTQTKVLSGLVSLWRFWGRIYFLALPVSRGCPHSSSPGPFLHFQMQQWGVMSPSHLILFDPLFHCLI